MLMNRIIGAFTFRKDVYSEVENDASFTGTAWVLVAVVAFLNALGGRAALASETGVVRWLLGSLVGTVVALIGFGVAMFVIAWVGQAVFKAQVSFDEMVRTLGLAYVWNIVGFLGILGMISGALVCVISPLLFLGVILSFVASLIAAKEALDLEWLQTVVTIIIGYVVIWIFTVIAGVILGLFGLGVAGLTGAFG